MSVKPAELIIAVIAMVLLSGFAYFPLKYKEFTGAARTVEAKVLLKNYHRQLKSGTEGNFVEISPKVLRSWKGGRRYVFGISYNCLSSADREILKNQLSEELNTLVQAQVPLDHGKHNVEQIIGETQGFLSVQDCPDGYPNRWRAYAIGVIGFEYPNVWSVDERGELFQHVVSGELPNPTWGLVFRILSYGFALALTVSIWLTAHAFLRGKKWTLQAPVRFAVLILNFAIFLAGSALGFYIKNHVG